MSGAKFVRLYPSDWRSGCIGLTLEQEGFYMRVCAFIYDTDKRLPADDSAAAKLMGLHTNAYRKVRDQLAALGKLVMRAGVWTVPRADKELAAATNSSRSQGRQTDQDTGRDTSKDTLGDTPHNTPKVFSEKDNKINAPLKSQYPIANSKVNNNVRSESETANGPDEISGLNGSTGEIIGGVAKLLNNLAPDYPTAKRIIASNVGIYGAAAVRDGYAELMADIADNKVRIPSAKTLLGYFKTASERPATERKTRPMSDFSSQRIERGREFLEMLNEGSPA